MNLSRTLAFPQSVQLDIERLLRTHPDLIIARLSARSAAGSRSFMLMMKEDGMQIGRFKVRKSMRQLSHYNFDAR